MEKAHYVKGLFWAWCLLVNDVTKVYNQSNQFRGSQSQFEHISVQVIRKVLITI